MITVRLDSREAISNKGLRKALEKINDITLETDKPLNVGDILVGKYLIERKSTTDILTRNKDGSLHIFDQLDRLVEQEAKGLIPIILINGSYINAWKYRGIGKQHLVRSQISGLLNTIEFKYGFRVFKFDDEQHVVNWIRNLIKRAKDPNKEQLRSLRTTPNRKMTMNEKALYILQGFKGIVPTKSRKLLKEYKSIENIFVSGSKERLASTIGEKYADEFYKLIYHNYEGEK